MNIIMKNIYKIKALLNGFRRKKWMQNPTPARNRQPACTMLYGAACNPIPNYQDNAGHLCVIDGPNDLFSVAPRGRVPVGTHQTHYAD